MIERIRAHAKEAVERENIEDPSALSSVLRLPMNGVQLKEDYVLFAHFELLKRLLADNVDKIRFCFDHDSGIRAACLATFVEEIKAERADATCTSLSRMD
ncbi:MAG TPA: hypothetical protein VGK27_02760 [Candidatus Deferrimicrobiaceae bacterium]|jgi:hypothetical protein